MVKSGDASGQVVSGEVFAVGQGHGGDVRMGGGVGWQVGDRRRSMGRADLCFGVKNQDGRPAASWAGRVQTSDRQPVRRNPSLTWATRAQIPQDLLC